MNEEKKNINVIGMRKSSVFRCFGVKYNIFFDENRPFRFKLDFGYLVITILVDRFNVHNCAL